SSGSAAPCGRRARRGGCRAGGGARGTAPGLERQGWSVHGLVLHGGRPRAAADVRPRVGPESVCGGGLRPSGVLLRGRPRVSCRPAPRPPGELRVAEPHRPGDGADDPLRRWGVLVRRLALAHCRRGGGALPAGGPGPLPRVRLRLLPEGLPLRPELRPGDVRGASRRARPVQGRRGEGSGPGPPPGRLRPPRLGRAGRPRECSCGASRTAAAGSRPLRFSGGRAGPRAGAVRTRARLGFPPGVAVAQRLSRAVSKTARTPVRIRSVASVPCPRAGPRGPGNTGSAPLPSW